MPESDWNKLLAGIDFTLPEGGSPPSIEKTPSKEASRMAGKKVFVQKIITEVWLYTDVEGKAFGHQGLQDIIIVGEMPYDEAIKMIGERKNKRRRSG
jgi:hypothetical protein